MRASLSEMILCFVIDVRTENRPIPSKGVEHRYPALQEVTMSRIGIPASASASVAALMHADLVPVIYSHDQDRNWSHFKHHSCYNRFKIGKNNSRS